MDSPDFRWHVRTSDCWNGFFRPSNPFLHGQTPIPHDFGPCCMEEFAVELFRVCSVSSRAFALLWSLDLVSDRRCADKNMMGIFSRTYCRLPK